MSKLRQGSILFLTTLVLCLIQYRAVVSSLRAAAQSWRSEPLRAVMRLVVSFALGQGIFWRIGYDQIGLFMDPKIQLGLGQRLAKDAYELLPATSRVAWVLKVLEIIADLGRAPAEGAVYRRFGLAPDGVAALITQPFWSSFEAAEKLTGVIIHPDRVHQPRQVQLSLGCLYGSLFRYAMVGFLW